MRRTLIRVVRLVALAGIATAALVAPVAAREPVDPNTLTPPPPDFFNATCYAQGRGITCDLAFSDPDIVDEPSGVVCDGSELLFSQTRSVVGKRFYDAEGLLLQRHFRESLTGSLSNPDTGLRVDFIGHATVIHNLAVPGDVTTGITSSTGLPGRFFVPGGGTVLIDAGRLVLDESNGEILSSHGPHHFDDYFVRGDAHALDPICDAVS
jgi:hypothetical protein